MGFFKLEDVSQSFLISGASPFDERMTEKRPSMRDDWETSFALRWEMSEKRPIVLKNIVICQGCQFNKNVDIKFSAYDAW
jgi:hypothetical protein